MFGIELSDLRDSTWHGNTLLEWLIALGIFLGVAIGVRLLQALAIGRARKLAQRTVTEVDDAWVHVGEATGWLLYFSLGVVVAREYVDLSKKVEEYVATGLFIALGIQGALWLQRAVAVAMSAWGRKQGTSHAGTAAAAVRFVSRLVIWSALLLVILANLGVELSAVVAGLGVGGIAAALAVQSILGDVFAGLSMYFDRPFDIGDFIIFDDILGNVRKIGLRTTRIDSLGGEKVIYPNGELVKKCIRNYQRMQERRVVFSFGIEYNVPVDSVRKARDLAQSVIESIEGVRFDRAHFKQYGAYSLDFEVVYYVLSPDYGVYMALQHQINMGIYEEFERHSIPFAFPTSTVHLRGLGPLATS